MKFCPQCNAKYDDSMFFCLEDGQPLKSTDTSFQSNPATFEKTLTLPTQDDIIGEKTLALPTEPVTENNSVQTEVIQPVINPQESINVPKTVEKEVLPITKEPESKGKFLIAGGLLAGISLLGTALGGWWYLQKSTSEIATSNINKQSGDSNNNSPNTNSNFNLSNANLSANLSENSSNSSNVNSNLITNSNANKTTPKPSPTKDKSPTPTPKETPDETPTLTPTPTPKTPTPTPTPPPTPTPGGQPDIVDGGVLNGRAILLYQPIYPPAAKAAGVGGKVSVRVLIDENGRVVRANAVNGNPILYATSERAARSAKFSPMKSGGQPVKVSGVIVYNFVP